MHEYRYTADKIARRIPLIERQVVVRREVIPPFRYTQLDGPHIDPPMFIDEGTVILPGQIWGEWQTDFVLVSNFLIPAEWKQPVALDLPIGAAGDFSHPEALIYVDGQAVASCDRHHQRIVLPEKYLDGQPHRLVLHGWTGLGAFAVEQRSDKRLIMGECALVQLHQPTHTFVKMAKAAYETYTLLHDDDPTKHNLLNVLDEAFKLVDYDNVYRTIGAALDVLRRGISGAGRPVPVDLHAAGHAHIDVGWLWTVGEVRRKTGRTFANVLHLMDQYRDFRFTQSQPQLYEYIRRDYPDLFSRIKQRVTEGRWEPIGGMWVEADCNISGAEALARQLILGRRFFADQFGKEAESPVLWLPDVFGYPATLPQLIKEAGLDYFFTIKISWNQMNPMPYESFWWKGLDGTRVLSHFSTTPESYSGTRYTYNALIEPESMLDTWRNVRHKDVERDVLVSYGYGDGGGGPTPEMVENVELFQDFPGLPRMRFSRALDFFRTLEKNSGDALPTWTGELYLEFHRGTYTTQSRTKHANRKCEILLHDAEFMATLAKLFERNWHYPYDLLDEAWKLLCLNQFHDILPGSSITRVYDEATRDYERIWELGKQVQARASDVLRRYIEGEVIVVNTTGFHRHEVLDAEGRQAPVHTRPFSIKAVDMRTRPRDSRLSVSPLHLENRYVRLDLNANGDISRLYLKTGYRDLIPPGRVGNQWQAFEDLPLNWDAWDIDIFYSDKVWLADPAESIEVVEDTPLRATIELRRRILGSPYLQRISLENDSLMIRFDTEIDWRERHKLLKVAFPLDMTTTKATYDIQWGKVERPTYRNTSWDWARFEVCAHKWATLSEGDFGVSLLNDCKYGYDIHDNVMRLSLLRSPTFPDSEADQGLHNFTYALALNGQRWERSTIRDAYRLNDPLVVLGGGTGVDFAGFDLGLENDMVIFETVKWAENGEGMVVRLYEPRGQRGDVFLNFNFDVRQVWRTNLLEEKQFELRMLEDYSYLLFVKPYEVVTLLVIPA
ncbi:MAG: glycosyl hydrolase-related protein [Chloroflexi bacterium]|nr:glycosyl hydrolase-related protein [Chloroflexota bacterium]